MSNSLAKLFVSSVWDCVITPPTVRSSTIITSSVKSIVIAPAIPVAEPATSILPVVPVKVTVFLTPEPVPPAVKDIIPVVGAPGATTPEVVGNVYVSFVSAGNVIVLTFNAVTWPVVFVVTVSIAVKVAP